LRLGCWARLIRKSKALAYAAFPPRNALVTTFYTYPEPTPSSPAIVLLDTLPSTGAQGRALTTKPPNSIAGNFVPPIIRIARAFGVCHHKFLEESHA